MREHIHDISDVAKQGSTYLATTRIPLAGNFQNHMNYQHSSQLNTHATATTDINPTTLGPTEYFGMKNTDNFYAKLHRNYTSLKNTAKYLERNPFLE